MYKSKSTISKYLEEFLWWLKNDTIMCKELTVDGSTRWRTLANPVWNSTPKNGIQEIMYVINDEQVQDRISRADNTSSNSGNQNNLKVGDYVRFKHTPEKAYKVKEVLDDVYIFTNGSVAYRTVEFIMWEPEDGEWCLFYDENGYKTEDIFNKKDRFGYYPLNELVPYKVCEPKL